jgi:hypothetical protein
LIARDDLRKGIAIASQAFTNQLGIVWSGGGHRFDDHSTAYVRLDTLKVTKYRSLYEIEPVGPKEQASL